MFDRDHDEVLNYKELNNLQIATSGSPIETAAQFAFICQLLDQNPMRGINFAGLARVYLDSALPFDADLDTDHKKLFNKDAASDSASSGSETK